jgi:hypothetical protein
MFKIFIGIDIILYIVYIIWYYIMIKSISASTLKFHKVVAILLHVIAFANGQWNYIMLFAEDVKAWEKEFTTVEK